MPKKKTTAPKASKSTESSKSEVRDDEQAVDKQSGNRRFDALKIYLKDASFEAPSTPAIFLAKDLRPNVNLELQVRHDELNDANMDIQLIITLTAKSKEQTMYLVEVKQAGVFRVEHPDAEIRERMVEVTAPYVLLPYAREEINSLITKGGFGTFLLPQINFEHLHHQKKAKQKEQK